MRKRRSKYGSLTHSDHRLNLSPAGRNLFVSRDKQLQSKKARRIKILMRIVLALVIFLICAAFLLAAVFYIFPWLQSEIMLSESSSSSSASELSSSSALPEFDDMGLPVYGDEVNLFVVNEENPADSDFSPELSEFGGVQVDSRIVQALKMMVEAAKEDGLALSFTEGYISYDEQEERYNDMVSTLMEEQGLTTVMAREAAAELEPRPGESDFQSGMCLRLDANSETFSESRTCSWLKSNMGKYGFIFRYPEDKEDFTGLECDLTVIRYVGSDAALAMQQRSMCLEEYIDYLDSQ